MQEIKTLVSSALAQAAEPPTKAEPPATRMPPRSEEAWQSLVEPFRTLGDPQLEQMLGAATAFARDAKLRRRPRWLSLLGPSGTGKTMLAKALMRFIRQECLHFSPGYGITLTQQCLSVKWPATAAEMKKGDFDTVDLLVEKEYRWNRAKGCTYAFALIDDIGQVEDTAKAYLLGALGRIAEERLNEWTIWTSNLHLCQIAQNVDPRVASRMIRGQNVVVENDCQDFNLR